MYGHVWLCMAKYCCVCMAMYGYVWLSIAVYYFDENMARYGYVWLSIAVYVWPCMAMYG